MKQGKHIFCLTIILLAMNLLYSSNSEGSEADKLMYSDLNASNRYERIAIAKDILSKIKSLHSYLPTMKPSEIEWLMAEEKAIEKLRKSDASAALERMKNYDHSPEYQHFQLDLLLKKLEEDLQCIINKKTNLKSEMLCWVSVSINLPNKGKFHDPLMILRKHGRLPSDIGKKAGLYISNNEIIAFDYYSRGILKSIITPYISGTLSDDKREIPNKAVK